MDYHIARDGQQIGTVTEEQLRAGLADGTFLSTDLAWSEGMTDWKPVSEITGTRASRIAPNPISAPVRGVAAAPAQAVVGGKSGLATTSLVLGILSIIPCGFLTGLPAIITGHIARSKIKQSGGALLGEGKALAGLIMGYVSIGLTALAILASLAVPTFVKVQEKGLQARAIGNARQIITACRIYASDNNGRYPANLDVLVDQGLITDRKVLSCPILVNGEDQGWEYLGAKMSDSDSGDLILLISRWHNDRGMHIVGHGDSSVTTEVPNPARIRQ